MLTPMPTCAADPSSNACAHDRFEPMWDLDLQEETGIAGPYLFCCIAITAEQIAYVRTDALWLHLSDTKACLEHHTESAKERAANPCEWLHIANYAHDIQKLSDLLRARGEDPSELDAAMTRMGCGPRV